MSIYRDDEETQLETQILDTQDEVDTQEVDDQEMNDIQEESELEEAEPAAEVAIQSKKRAKREPAELQRDPGKSLLPFSKVQRIIKADKVGDSYSFLHWPFIDMIHQRKFLSLPKKRLFLYPLQRKNLLNDCVRQVNRSRTEKRDRLFNIKTLVS